MPPRKGNGCSPQFPRDSVAAALAPPPLLKLTPHPLQGGHTLLPFHRIHRLPSKLLAQTMLSQGSSSFHACLPERHGLLVPSGPILIAGGFNGFLGACPTSACQPHVLSSAELFNPTSQGFTALANPMTTPRQGAVAALLSDGTVLIAGGTDGNHILSSAEIYDPSAQTFTALPSSMVTPRLGAIAFGNAGEVVIAGGTDGNVTLSSAEIYDPARKVFTALPNKMSTPRMGAAASSFGVSTLIAGGSNGGQILASVEVFDATSQTFALQPYQLNTGRTGGSATTVAGWVPIPALSSAAVPTVPLFPTERFSVVIFGGHGNDGVLNSVEVFESSFGPGPCTTPPCPE